MRVRHRSRDNEVVETASFTPFVPATFSAVVSHLTLRSFVALRQCQRQYLIAIEQFPGLVGFEAPWASYLCPSKRAPAGEASCFTVVAKLLHEWARGSCMRLPDDFRTVNMWTSNGLTLEDLAEINPGSEVGMKEAARCVELSGSLALALAEGTLSTVAFAGAETSTQAMRDITSSIHSIAMFRTCRLEHSFSSCHVGDDSGGGNTKNVFCVEVSLGEVGIVLKARYRRDIDSPCGIDNETSAITCECRFPESDSSRQLFRVDFYHVGNPHSIDFNDDVLAQLVSIIFNGKVDNTSAFNFLWRLLCAPTVAWPWVEYGDGPWTWVSDRCSCVGAELVEDTCAADRHSSPAFLRFRRIFEIVADAHLSSGKFATASSSPLDNKDVLENISYGLAGPAKELPDSTKALRAALISRRSPPLTAARGV